MSTADLSELMNSIKGFVQDDLTKSALANSATIRGFFECAQENQKPFPHGSMNTAVNIVVVYSMMVDVMVKYCWTEEEVWEQICKLVRGGVRSLDCPHIFSVEELESTGASKIFPTMAKKTIVVAARLRSAKQGDQKEISV